MTSNRPWPQLRKENRELRREKDFFKLAATYLAKEQLHGMGSRDAVSQPRGTQLLAAPVPIDRYLAQEAQPRRLITSAADRAATRLIGGNGDKVYVFGYAGACVAGDFAAMV